MLKIFLMGVAATFGVGTSFVLGYRFGQDQKLVVYKDVLIVQIFEEKRIGQVAGTESAKMPEKQNSKTVSNKTKGNTDLLQEINVYRKRHGLGELLSDNELCVWVRERIEELKQKGYLDDHQGFKERSQQFLQEKGFTKLAENIA